MGIGNPVHQFPGTADVHGVILQFNGLRGISLSHITLEHCTDLHTSGQELIHVDADKAAGSLLHLNAAAGNSLRQLHRIGKSPVPRSGDLAQIRSHGDVGVVQLQKVPALSVEPQVDCGVPAAGKHQVPVGKQAVLVGKSHRDPVDPLAVIRGNGTDHVHPESDGNDQGQ